MLQPIDFKGIDKMRTLMDISMLKDFLYDVYNILLFNETITTRNWDTDVNMFSLVNTILNFIQCTLYEYQ